MLFIILCIELIYASLLYFYIYNKRRVKIWLITGIIFFCSAFIMLHLRYLLYPTKIIFIVFLIMELVIFVMLLGASFLCLDDR